MRFSYDPRHNVAYTRFGEKRAEVESLRLGEEIVVDMAPDGTVYGIELLNANEQLRGEIRTEPGAGVRDTSPDSVSD
jgi:uncharacterized protein YuzE